MKKGLLLCLVLLIALGTACGGTTNNGQETNSEQGQSEEENQLPEGDNNDSESSVTQPLDPEEVTFSVLNEQLQAGSSQTEVTALLGTADAEISSALWRYDIGAQPGYEFHSMTEDPDVQSLKDGQVATQIFVIFDAQQQLERLNYYETDAQGHVYGYYLLEDGSTGSEGERLN